MRSDIFFSACFSLLMLFGCGEDDENRSGMAGSGASGASGTGGTAGTAGRGGGGGAAGMTGGAGGAGGTAGGAGAAGSSGTGGRAGAGGTAGAGGVGGGGIGGTGGTGGTGGSPITCGEAGSGGAANQVSGTPLATAFVAQEAISVHVSASGDSFNGPSTTVAITDFTNACANEAANRGVRNAKILVFFLGRTDASGASTPATMIGTYTIVTSSAPPSSLSAQAFYNQNGSNCLPSDQKATSGTVTITNVGSGAEPAIQGTFGLYFSQTGQCVSGRFSTTYCSSLNPNRTPLQECI